MFEEYVSGWWKKAVSRQTQHLLTELNLNSDQTTEAAMMFLSKWQGVVTTGTGTRESHSSNIKQRATVFSNLFHHRWVFHLMKRYKFRKTVYKQLCGLQKQILRDTIWGIYMVSYCTFSSLISVMIYCKRLDTEKSGKSGSILCLQMYYTRNAIVKHGSLFKRTVHRHFSFLSPPINECTFFLSSCIN